MPSCCVNSLPHCCGFMEAGDFSIMTGSWYDLSSDSNSDLIQKILNHAEGRPVIFNFVKECLRDDDDDAILGEFRDEYEVPELRKAVMEHKNVIDIGEHINPGTDNIIHSLIIKDYK